MKDSELICQIITKYDFVAPDELQKALQEVPEGSDPIDFLVAKELLNDRQAMIVRKRLAADKPPEKPIPTPEPEPEPISTAEIKAMAKPAATPTPSPIRRPPQPMMRKPVVVRGKIETPKPLEVIHEAVPLPTEEELRGKQFGEILVALRLISEESLRKAVEQQEKWRKTGRNPHLGELLVKAGALSPKDLIYALKMQGKTLYCCSMCNVQANIVNWPTEIRPICPECLSRLVESNPAAQFPAGPFQLVEIDGLQPDPLAGSMYKDFQLNFLYWRGMSYDIYKGEQTSLGRTVGIAILSESLAYSPDWRETFIASARNAARLSHPYAAAGIDVGEISGRPCYVFEFPEGHSLEDLVIRQGTLAPKAAMKVALSVANCLKLTHEKGDYVVALEPSCVFATIGSGIKVIGLGLGIAGESSAGFDLPGGNPAYIAPEVISGSDPTDQSDAFSLGCLLYFMLTGQSPMRGNSWLDTAARQIFVEPQPVGTIRSDLNYEMDKVLTRLLEKDSEKRFDGDSDIVAALSSITGDKVDTTSPLDAQPGVPKPLGITVPRRRLRRRR
jgi:hypothetical protein